MNNELLIKIIASLDYGKSINQINADITKIKGQLKHLRLQASLDKNKSNTNIQNQIAALNKQRKQLYVDLKLRQKNLKKQYLKAVASIQPKSVNVNVNTSNAVKQVQNVDSSIKNTNTSVTSLANSLKGALNNAGLVTSSQLALQLIRKAAREATEAVKEYDKYVTNLSIITGGSRDDANNILADLSEKSFEFKVDISELEGAYETLLRTGKSAKELDDYLKSTVYLSKIGFEDMDTSAENLVVIGNAFNKTSEEMDNVVSSLVALDTASNTVAGKLSTALAKTGQNAQLAGVNIDELGAIISGLKDTTGKTEDSIAVSLNGILSRIYNVKLGKYEIELEDGSTEDITESLNNTERMLKNVGISLRSQKGEFKEFTDIINELVPKWDKLNTVQQNSVAFTFAGTHHKNTFISLIESWQRINELTEISANSAGQVELKYNHYLDSIQAKSAELSTAAKDLWNNLISPDFAGNIIEAGTAVTQFTDKYQVLQTALKSAAFYGIAKGIIGVKNGFSGMVTSVKNVSSAMNLVSQSGAITGQNFLALQQITGSLTDKQLMLVLSNSNLNEAQMLQIIQTRGLTAEEAKQKLVTLGLIQTNQAATASTFSLSGAFKTLWATIVANPIAVLTIAFTGFVTIYQTVQRKQKEARQAAVDKSDKYDEQAQALEDLRQKYIDIVDSESDVTTKTEELNEWKKTLIETYGFEKEAIENVNLEREKGLGLLDDEIEKNRINSAETWLTENKDAYEDAKEKLTRANNSSDNSVIAHSSVVSQVAKSTIKEYSNNFDEILEQLSISNPTHDNPLAQIKIQGGNTLQQYENLKKVLNDITSIKVTDGLNKAEEALYNDLLKKQKEYKKVVTDDIIDIYETGNKYTNEIKLFNFETDNGINFENVTQDTYKEFRDKFLESFGFGYKKDSTDFTLDIEQTLLEMMPDFEKVYRGIEDSIIEETSEGVSNSSETIVKSLEDVDDKYSQMVDDVSKKTSLLKTAMTEMRDSGHVSVSTYAELAAKGDEYVDCLEIQNGKLVLNVKKLQDLEAQEYKNAIAANNLAIAQIKASTSGYGLSEALQDEINDLQKENTVYQQILSDIYGVKPDTGSGDSSKPQQVIDYEKWVAQQEHEISMGRLKEDEAYYSEKLRRAEEAYKDLADYEQDLWKIQEEVYNGRKQLAEEAFDNEHDLFKQRVDDLEQIANKISETSIDTDGTKLNTQEKYREIASAYEEIRYAIEDEINRIVQIGVEGHEDLLDGLNKQLEETTNNINDTLKSAVEAEKSLLEKAREAKSSEYDDQIDKVKAQQEAAQKAADAEIEAIQTKIDNLQKVNDEKQREYDIEKAKQDLEKAGQRTRRVYGSDGSIEYRADTYVINEAQKNLDDLLLEKQIDGLENQKTVLEEMRDKESESYDTLIADIESQKEQDERQFDSLLQYLDNYLNPTGDTSNADVWSAIAKIEGATFESGKWCDKDGNIIDIDGLYSVLEKDKEDKTSPNVSNSNVANEPSKVSNGVELIEKLLTKMGAKPDIIKGIVDNLNNNRVDPRLYNIMFSSSQRPTQEALRQFEGQYRIDPDSYEVANKNTTVAPTFNGDIVINNPVGNSDDLARELMMNLANAIERKTYSNLKKF